MKAKNKPKPTLSLRINQPLAIRLTQASDRQINPYAPYKTAIVERGIELALKELEKKAKS